MTAFKKHLLTSHFSVQFEVSTFAFNICLQNMFMLIYKNLTITQYNFYDADALHFKFTCEPSNSTLQKSIINFEEHGVTTDVTGMHIQIQTHERKEFFAPGFGFFPLPSFLLSQKK